MENLNNVIKVLIASQNTLTSKMVVGVLDSKSKFNYNFNIVDNTKEAKEKLDKHDLIISGLGSHLPGNKLFGDGYDFLKYAKEIGYKCIIMTGWADYEKKNAILNGADGFISLELSNDITDKITQEVERVLQL